MIYFWGLTKRIYAGSYKYLPATVVTQPMPCPVERSFVSTTWRCRKESVSGLVEMSSSVGMY